MYCLHSVRGVSDTVWARELIPPSTPTFGILGVQGFRRPLLDLGSDFGKTIKILLNIIWIKGVIMVKVIDNYD